MRIETRNLSKSFGSTRALAALSCTIEPGQIVSVLGLNGAGKTTLFRLLAGILAPDEGEILYDGERFTRDRIDLRRRFQFLPDVPAVFAEMTPLRHVGMCLDLFQADRPGIEDRILEVFRDLEITPLAQTPIQQLSRGEAYKAALAALLVVDPEVWLLDEPFASGMDPIGLTALKRRAAEATERGRTVLYTTQILDVAETFSNRVCILDHGALHAFDGVAELRGRAGGQGGVLETLFERLREERK